MIFSNERSLTNLTNWGYYGWVMAKMLNIYEAKTHLSALVEQAAKGEEIVIAKAGKPLAKLVPLEKTALAPRVPGQNLLGITYLAPDWDDPLPEEILRDFGY